MNDNLIPKQDGSLDTHDVSGGNADIINKTNGIKDTSNDSTAGIHEQSTPAFIGMNTPIKSQAHVPVSPSISAPTPTSTPSTTPPIPQPPSPSSPYSNPIYQQPKPSYMTAPIIHPTPVKHASMKVVWIILSIVIILLLVAGGYFAYTSSYFKDGFFGIGSVTEDVDQDDKVDPVINQDTSSPANQNGSQISQSQQTTREKVVAYIRQNINTLSQRKSSKNFTVTNIRFDGASRAIVTYTDGTSIINAVAQFRLDQNGTVRIDDFTILSK
jgi:hypothetical protein